MTLLSADDYFNRKVKVGNNLCGSHFGTCVWFGEWWLTRDLVEST